MKNILIIAGEVSGDIHASHLIKNLKEQNSELSFFGIGGKLMREEGVDILYPMEKLSIIGLSEVFAKIIDVFRAFHKVIFEIKKRSPKTAILIDYPGFNLRLAKKLKKMGIKVIYYITPQVWAWGKSRLYSIQKYVDKAIVIFKFEEELFKSYGIDVSFAGHPLMDKSVPKTLPDRKSMNLDQGKTTIALLPGSRESEVRRLLPTMLKTAELILQKKETQFILLKSSAVNESIYENILSKSSTDILSMKDKTYECLSLSDFVFLSSGTATLEACIMEKPMLITYKTSFLTAFLFKIFVKTKLIGLVNIIAGKEIAPEILQYNATSKNLADAIVSIISSKEKMQNQINALKNVRASLGETGASKRAAELIKTLLIEQQ